MLDILYISVHIRHFYTFYLLIYYIFNIKDNNFATNRYKNAKLGHPSRMSLFMLQVNACISNRLC